MKKYARIQDGIIFEFFETDGDITQMFHPDLIWVECNSSVQQGWTYNGTAFSEPEPVIAPPYVPQSVSPAQGLMALYALKGITEDDILAAIDTIEDAALRYQAQISYKKATVWERISVSMKVVAGLLALTESDQDELFTIAATYANL